MTIGKALIIGREGDTNINLNLTKKRSSAEDHRATHIVRRFLYVGMIVAFALWMATKVHDGSTLDSASKIVDVIVKIMSIP